MFNRYIGRRYKMRNDIETIYHTYADTLYRVAYSYMKNDHDALDIVQNVFYKYYKKSPLFLNEKHRKAYLIKMVVNECKDLWKKQNRIHLENEMIEQAKDEYSHYQALAFHDLLDSLDEKYRIVVVLYYLEELSVNEIANILSLSTSAIKMRLKKAKELLKQEIGD